MREVDDDVREQLENLLRRSISNAQKASSSTFDVAPPSSMRATGERKGLFASLFILSGIILIQPAMYTYQNSLGTSTLPKVTPVIEAVKPVHNESRAPEVVRIDGMRTKKSVVTGIVDPVTMTASYYWTLVLHNETRQPKEAKFDLNLPDGAAVTRATLWINGVPQEAAFQSTAAVQQAYDWIVTSHRDPLLITQNGNKYVSVKASPVMPGHDMQLRIGITAPMSVRSGDQAVLKLPSILNSNIRLSAVQNVHLGSVRPLSSSDPALAATFEKHGYLLRGNIQPEGINSVSIFSPRDANDLSFATRATHSNPAAYIHASINGELTLTKTATLPDGKFVAAEDAAFRLSNLWAHQEIMRLAANGQTADAIELASIYRIVSPVSGAVVLERKSDYEYQGLDRNLYRSTAYTSDMGNQNRAPSAPSASLAEDKSFAKTEFTRRHMPRAFSKASPSSYDAGKDFNLNWASSPVPRAKPQPEQTRISEWRSMDSAASNGTIGPQERTGGGGVIGPQNPAPRVHSQADRMMQTANIVGGPVGTWIAENVVPRVSSADGFCPLTAEQTIMKLWFALYAFAIPLVFTLQAMFAAQREQTNRLKRTTLGCGWLSATVLCPIIGVVISTCYFARKLFGSK